MPWDQKNDEGRIMPPRWSYLLHPVFKNRAAKNEVKNKNRAENHAEAISKIAPKIAPRSFKKSRQKSRRSEMNELKIVAKRDKFQTWNGFVPSLSKCFSRLNFQSLTLMRI